MKKILLSLTLLLASGFIVKTFAKYPCNGGPNNCGVAVANTVVTITKSEVNPNNNTQLLVTFDVSFDLSYNNGNTHFYINSFLAGDYPEYWPCGNGNHPAPLPGVNVGDLGTARDQIGKSFLDIQLLNPARGAVGVPVPMTISTIYQYDASVVLTSPANSPGMTATKVFLSGTTDRVTIKNSTVILNGVGVNDKIQVKSDVWAENGNAHCYQAGISQFFNDPTIGGIRNCNNPRQYAINISTDDPTVRTITYKVYLDVNSNGTLEIGTDQLAFTSGNIQISAVGGAAPDTYAPGFQTLPNPYANTQPWSEYNYLILVEGPTLSNSIVGLLLNPGCIPLPVNFKSFTATRNNANVMVKWETSTEINNSGFAVERNINGVWQQVAFVPSQATGGNSNALLTYTFNDLNSSKGVSQYRIKQIDIDAQFKYSEVRSVRGDGQAGKIIVYPNPSSDGKVNVVFEDSKETREVSVIDMSGRIVKQFRNVTNNNISIENLTPGIYSLRVFVPATGEQAVQKIVVNKQ